MIIAEVVGERLELSYSELPGKVYTGSVEMLIYEAASEPYRRGESRRWFLAPHRPALTEMNGRPC